MFLIRCFVSHALTYVILTFKGAVTLVRIAIRPSVTVPLKVRMTNFMMTNLNIIKSIMYIKSFLQDLAMKRIRGATAIPDGQDHHTVDNIL